jgi:short-subunit dehydrogenase
MTDKATPGSFNGKLALVTGASSGIGRALAKRLARDGALLALVGRDAARLNETVGACRDTGSPSTRPFVFDLSDSDGIANLVGTIRDEFGNAPDILIHAAGAATVGRIEDTPVSAVREVLAVNLLAAIALTAELLPHMRARGNGMLCFISSGTAYFGVPTEASYCASKAGLERFVESLRAEIAGSGVSVSIVSPGPVETPLMRSPRTYGSASLVGRPKVAARPEAAADEIVKSLGGGGKRIELTWRPRLVRHLSYWAPSLLRLMIERQSRPMTSGLDRCGDAA